MCDIDETLLRFEGIDHKWWHDKFIEIYKYTKNYDLSDDLVIEEWKKTIESISPKYTDKEGFLNMLNKIKKTDSCLKFITARNAKLIGTTKKNFETVGLKYDDFEVHHLSGEDKGTFIHNNIDLSGYNNIIFIDDFIFNIRNVKDIFDNKIRCFLFKMR